MYTDILAALWNDGTLPIFILAAITLVPLGLWLHRDLNN